MPHGGGVALALRVGWGDPWATLRAPGIIGAAPPGTPVLATQGLLTLRCSRTSLALPYSPNCRQDVFSETHIYNPA